VRAPGCRASQDNVQSRVHAQQRRQDAGGAPDDVIMLDEEESELLCVMRICVCVCERVLFFSNLHSLRMPMTRVRCRYRLMV
jgi:hypothetical protein